MSSEDPFRDLLKSNMYTIIGLAIGVPLSTVVPKKYRLLPLTIGFAIGSFIDIKNAHPKKADERKKTPNDPPQSIL